MLAQLLRVPSVESLKDKHGTFIFMNLCALFIPLLERDVAFLLRGQVLPQILQLRSLCDLTAVDLFGPDVLKTCKATGSFFMGDYKRSDALFSKVKKKFVCFLQ